MYETLLYCEVHEFSFPMSPHLPKTDSEQESYVHFIPVLQSVPTNFRTRNVQCSCHISLYGSWNSLILNALEWEFDGASEYQLFLPCTSLSMCKIWWKQWGLLSNFGDVDELDFFFDHEFMGMLCYACKIIQVHNLQINAKPWSFMQEVKVFHAALIPLPMLDMINHA